jgi:hypothetical protein
MTQTIHLWSIRSTNNTRKVHVLPNHQKNLQYHYIVGNTKYVNGQKYQWTMGITKSIHKERNQGIEGNTLTQLTKLVLAVRDLFLTKPPKETVI